MYDWPTSCHKVLADHLLSALAYDLCVSNLGGRGKAALNYDALIDIFSNLVIFQDSFKIVSSEEMSSSIQFPLYVRKPLSIHYFIWSQIFLPFVLFDSNFLFLRDKQTKASDRIWLI